MKNYCKWFVAFVLITIMWKLAYNAGRENGERGLGYWQGWQDAMIQTEYGTKPVEGKFSLK